MAGVWLGSYLCPLDIKQGMKRLPGSNDLAYYTKVAEKFYIVCPKRHLLVGSVAIQIGTHFELGNIAISCDEFLLNFFECTTDSHRSLYICGCAIHTVPY
jgi:hypothetical protein